MMASDTSGDAMPSHPNTMQAPSQRLRELVWLALWAGLVTGFAELVVIGIRLLGPGFVQRSRDAVWMIPAFNAGLFALVAGVIVSVSWLVPVSWRVAAGLFGGLGALLVLRLFDWLHPLAALVLAAGIGSQVARFLAGRVPSASRLLQRSLPWLALSVGVLAAASLGWRAVRERWLVHTRPAADRDAPNLLFLLLDTVRATDLSLYGYPRPTTPRLEQFAERATVFDNALAPGSWTLPSHASMFTGYWPFKLGVTWERGLGQRWQTLAEVLRSHGYATAAFAGNSHWISWETGLGQGFEHLDDYPVTMWTATQATAFGKAFYGPTRRTVVAVTNRLPVLWRLRLGRRLPVVDQTRSAAQINTAFLGWLERARPAPFFAFLNFMDAHDPYTPPDSFRSLFRSTSARRAAGGAESSASPNGPWTPADVQHTRDVYNGSIVYLDAELGILFRELDRRGLLDNTLVVVTADHGEEFAEHGLVEHGNSLYRPSLHVPLLIRFPGHVPEGQRVKAPASLRNLAATLLELLRRDRRAALPGRSLARFWSMQDPVPDTLAAGITRVTNRPQWFPASRGDLNSITFDGYRYIRNEGDGVEELYDFTHDYLERWNLAGTTEGGRLVPRYRAALDALLAGGPEPRLADQ
jgi:arylsulfatase A-like enzyme